MPESDVGGDAGSPAPRVQDDQRDHDVNANDLGEKAPVVARKLPPTPPRREVEEHEVNHYPYRAWCRSCVASAGRRDGHPSHAGETGGDHISVVAVDYCFFTDNADEGTDPTERERQFVTISVAKDKRTRMMFADVVHQKGADPHAVKVLAEHILFLGHAEIRLRSDGENPINALLS